MRRYLLAGLLALPAPAIALADDFAVCAQDANAKLKLASCTRLIATRPDLAAAYSSRGDALADLGQPDEAIADYSRAIALDRTLTAALYNRGLQNLVTGQAQAAAADFDAVLSQDGADAAALSGRGIANSVLGKAAEAVADFNHALALDPGYVRGYLSRATLSLERGNFAEANADFDAALRLHHGDREALAGRVLADSKQLPVAAETTASTTKMDPALETFAAQNEDASPLTVAQPFVHRTVRWVKKRTASAKQPTLEPQAELHIVSSR